MRILRLTLVTSLTGLSRSSIYRHERAGSFPPRVRLGANSVGWREADIVAWLESRPSVAASDISDGGAS